MSRFDSLYRMLENGVDFETAGHACMLPLGVLFSMLEKGRIEETRLSKNPNLKVRKAEVENLELWQESRSAIAKSKAVLLMSINAAANDGDWRAAAWGLEKKYPAEYGSLQETKKQLRDIQENLKGLE